MKKLMLWVALLGISSATPYAQTTVVAPAKPKTETAKTTTKKTDVKPGTSVGSAGANRSAPLKKDGTPDKRYKSNQHLRKDGTPDKRYTEHKTPPTKAPVVK